MITTKSLSNFLIVSALLGLTACGGGSKSSSSTSTTTSSTNSTAATSSSTSSTASSIAATAVTYPTHEVAADYVWETATETKITFYDTSIVAVGAGATVDKTKVTITAGGNYRFNGTLLNGQIYVNTTSKDTVRLIFDGINITNTTTAPVMVESAEKVVVVLAGTTKNYLTDPATYVYATGVDEPNAALFSKANLSITGTGSLSVDANSNDGITGKDGLVIHSGTITVDAIDDGIRGKDYLAIKNGTFTITSGGDALKADNEDANTGIVDIAGGKFTLTANAGDAISGESAVQITGGDFTIKAGANGSSTTVTSTSNSMKGIKATANLSIFDGTFTINSADDSLHANGNVQINGGIFAITSGDDGAHADNTLTINGGNINVSKSYEGLEGATININGGTTRVTTSDDGVNVASTGTNLLNITGGYLYVNSSGDGLDANGSIKMSGGTVIVSGPTANNNGPLDYDGSFTISGGTLIAAGSSGMAQAPGTASTQNSVKVTFTSSQTANKIVRIQTADSTELVTFAPAKTYSSFVFSSPNLTTGIAYDLYQAGASTATAVDGLYTGGTYSGGTKATSFTPSSKVTNVTK